MKDSFKKQEKTFRSAPRESMISGISLFQKSSGEKIDINLTQNFDDASRKSILTQMELTMIKILGESIARNVFRLSSEEDALGAIDVNIHDPQSMRQHDLAMAYLRTRTAMNDLLGITPKKSPIPMRPKAEQRNTLPQTPEKPLTPEQKQLVFHLDLSSRTKMFFKIIKQLPNFEDIRPSISSQAQNLLDAVKATHPDNGAVTRSDLLELSKRSHDLLIAIGSTNPAVLDRDLQVEGNIYEDPEGLVGYHEMLIAAVLNSYEKELS